MGTNLASSDAGGNWMDGRMDERVHDCFDYALYYYTGIGPGNVSLMNWRFERGADVVTIPLEEYQGLIPFLVGFWIDDDSRRHACRAGLCKLVDLALRSAHLARLHFGVLF